MAKDSIMLINPKPKIYHFHSSHQQAQKTRKILLYLFLAVLIASGIFFWQKELSKLRNQSTQKIAQSEEQFYNNLEQSLVDSDKNSFELIVLGKNMLDKNLIDGALVCFKVASEKDKNYRDAFFYLGYSYLKKTEKQNNNETTEQENNAKEAFLKAKDLDPLYAQTYEFLAYIYNNLGDEENAQLCYNKYQELNKE